MGEKDEREERDGRGRYCRWPASVDIPALGLQVVGDLLPLDPVEALHAEGEVVVDADDLGEVVGEAAVLEEGGNDLETD